MRFALAAIYDALTANDDDEQRYARDVRLGLIDPDEPVEVPDDERLDESVPVARDDPAAMAALAKFGDSLFG